MNDSSLESLIGDACKSLSQTCESQVKMCEDKVKRSPLPSVLVALGIGYLLQGLPLRGIISGLLRLILTLIKPTIMVYGLTKIFYCLFQKCETEGKGGVVKRKKNP